VRSALVDAPIFCEGCVDEMMDDNRHRFLLAGYRMERAPHPYQVVGRHREHKLKVDTRRAPKFGLPDLSNGLTPPKTLFDALADPLADEVAGLPSGAPVNSRATAPREVCATCGVTWRPRACSIKPRVS
jgi:hypothetical protein